MRSFALRLGVVLALVSAISVVHAQRPGRSHPPIETRSGKLGGAATSPKVCASSLISTTLLNPH